MNHRDHTLVSRTIKTLYFLVFGGTASFMVFISQYYQDAGLSGKEMGFLNALYWAAAVIAQPLWGTAADKWHNRRRILFLCAIGAGVSGVSFIFPSTFGGFLLSCVPLAICFSALSPLLDSLTFKTLREKGRHFYTHYRVWGTIGFMVIVLPLGAVLDRLGLRFMFVTFGLMMTAVAIGTLFLPLTEKMDLPNRRARAGWEGVREILRQRPFMFFLLCVFLCRSAEAAMWVFFAPFIKSLGGGAVMVSAAWVAATAAELAMFLVAPGLMRRWGAKKFILAGFLAAAARWALLSLVTTPLQILPIQLFHSLTFGALYVGSVTFVDMTVPRHLKSTGQALYASIGFGLGTILGSVNAGWLYDWLGIRSLCLISGGTALCAAAVFYLFVERDHRQTAMPG